MRQKPCRVGIMSKRSNRIRTHQVYTVVPEDFDVNGVVEDDTKSKYLGNSLSLIQLV